MGVWTDITANMPRVKPENPQYQAKVMFRRGEIEQELGPLKKDLATVTRTYIMARDEVEAKEEELKALKLTLEATVQMLVDTYDDNSVANVKLENGNMVRVEIAPYPTVKNKVEFWEWCRKEGLEREMHLHSKTTESLTKERLKKGDGPPPGVEVFSKAKIVLTRA